MSDDTTTPTFDFDSAPSAGQTLTDQQPERNSGDDEYANFDKEVEIKTPVKGQKYSAAVKAPRTWNKDGASGVVIDFTIVDGDLAGEEYGLFLTLTGPTATRVRRSTADLAKLCKHLNIPPQGKTSDLLREIKGKAGEEVVITLNVSKDGGVFVNL